MSIEIFEVGGAVRDKLLGIKSKDVDFVVIAPSFDVMRTHLLNAGFEIFVEHPEFVTIRAKVPVNHILRERTNVADFVLARKDGPSSDGRRPDFVKPGSLHDDLARRDFTVNAMALDVHDNLIDPFGGAKDIEDKLLNFVGNPFDRIIEDGLRVMRAIRFEVTKGLSMTAPTWNAIKSIHAADALDKVSIERIRDELEKALAYNTPRTLNLLKDLPELGTAIWRGGLRLSATMRK